MDGKQAAQEALALALSDQLWMSCEEHLIEIERLGWNGIYTDREVELAKVCCLVVAGECRRRRTKRIVEEQGG
jgi:hypothetical protein